MFASITGYSILEERKKKRSDVLAERMGRMRVHKEKKWYGEIHLAKTSNKSSTLIQ